MPRFGDIAGFLLKTATPVPTPPKCRGVPLELGCRYCFPRGEDPKVLIPAITFEVTQSIRARYINVRDGRTDGRMDGQPTIAISRFALRALRGKN